MDSKQFTAHACEQVLRFTNVNDWNDLPEKIKVQLAFNMGVVALGLGLTKEDGYMAMANTCDGSISVQDLHEHMRLLVKKHSIEISEENVTRPF